jgi:hypothetical protein
LLKEPGSLLEPSQQMVVLPPVLVMLLLLGAALRGVLYSLVTVRQQAHVSPSSSGSSYPLLP